MVIIAGITGAVGGFILALICWAVYALGLLSFYYPMNWGGVREMVLVGAIAGVVAGIGPRWSETNIVYGSVIGLIAGLLIGPGLGYGNIISTIILTVITCLGYAFSIGIAYIIAEKI